MADQEKFIQVGFTALRDPKTGDFLPAVPLYIKAEDAGEGAEEALLKDFAKLAAQRIRRYRERCAAEGVAI